MPKNKPHSGTSKRFRITGTGKLMRRRANRNHLLEHKSSSRTRRLHNEVGPVTPADAADGEEAARSLPTEYRSPYLATSLRRSAPLEPLTRDTSQWHA